MRAEKWRAEAVDTVSVIVHLEDDPKGHRVRIISAERILLREVELTTRDTLISIETGKPLFAEILSPDGNSMQYVRLSGKTFYLTGASAN